MPFAVRMSPRAEADLEEACAWAAQHAPVTAAEWRNRFKDALLSLAEHPERCPLAAEDRRLYCGLRQLLFGKRANTYRVLFTISESTVRILAIRRASRRAITRKDLGL